VKFTVGVSKNLEVFQVHKKILCNQAAYFEKMFNGNFKEGIEQSATFPEDEPCTWKHFIGWLYKGIIEPQTGGPELVTDRIKLFCLAEKYGIPNLQDASMDSLITTFRSRNTSPSLFSILPSYSMTSSGSKLRLYIARSFVFDTLVSGEDFHDWTNRKLLEAFKENDDLLLDTLACLRLQYGKAFPRPHQQPACDYHQHAQDEPCPYTKK
jgi:hypothetical protein